MDPLVSHEVMRECDARAVSRRGVEALVDAAGTALTQCARRLLGGLYGRRIAVVTGPGLNGADGVVASRYLRARGARVDRYDVADQPTHLVGYDLYIDAAFGLGCSRPYVAPRVAPGTLVLCVDLPSGVDADTGAVMGSPPVADVTLAMGALKYAHVDGPAASLVGRVEVASLGIVVPTLDAVVRDEDLAGYVLASHDDHKWTHALGVLAGSPPMPGAARLVCDGAIAGGASMVRLTSRGTVGDKVRLAPEVVRDTTRQVDTRCRAVVAGPGLGLDCASWLTRRLATSTAPLVLDADALRDEVLSHESLRGREVIMTPHEGEFSRLGGVISDERRIPAARALAAARGATVLLKGPTTVVATPDGRVRVVTAGDWRLATAGTGDVLAGAIGAALARGHDPLEAAALSAQLHAMAGCSLEPYAPARRLAAAMRRILAER